MEWITKNAANFCREHYEVPIIATLCYVIMLLALPRFMEKRQPFELKYPAALWNLLIAGFSFIASVAYTPGLLNEWINGAGLSKELCSVDHEINPWVYLFIFSKIPEFIDTFILILKKKPLIFLHWYHHIFTMAFCWLLGSNMIPNSGVFTAMNLFVHSIMYFYYLCSGLRIFWPQWARTSITVLQILQMFGGMAAIIHNLRHCPVTDGRDNTPVYLLGLVMYTSFAILFINFFIHDQCKPKQARTAKKQE